MTRQEFKNTSKGPVYVHVEPWAHVFELEPGEALTLDYLAREDVPALQVEFLGENEIVLWPNYDESRREVEILIDGEPAEPRSWKFKHIRNPLSYN